MDIIDGKYKIEHTKIGHGGFSEVFLGKNLSTNETSLSKKSL